MKVFLGELDGVTVAVSAIGIVAGAFWLIAYPAGLVLIGLGVLGRRA